MRLLPVGLHIIVAVGLLCVSLHGGSAVFLRTKQTPPLYLAVGRNHLLIFTEDENEAHAFVLEEPGLAGTRGTVSIKSEEHDMYIRHKSSGVTLSAFHDSNHFKRDATFLKEEDKYMPNAVSFLYQRGLRNMANVWGNLGMIWQWQASTWKESLSFELVESEFVPLPPSPPTPRQDDDMWTSCSVGCGTGVQTKIQLCPQMGCLREQTRECTKKQCVRGCSKQCGGGTIKAINRCRGRRCTVSIPCNTHECDKEIGLCDHKLCQNGGTCHEVRGGFTCRCALHYTGDYCDQLDEFLPPPSPPTPGTDDTWTSCSVACGTGQQSKIQVCPSFGCLQGETRECNKQNCVRGCSKTCGGGTVEVRTSCRGHRLCTRTIPCNTQKCEKEIGMCDHDLCQNRGTCREVPGGFTCLCAIGYSGDYCQERESAGRCASNPCRNNAECSETKNNYRCHCLPGYSGGRCKIEDKCVTNNPCVNGECMTTTDDPGYMCECPSTHTGIHCDEEVTSKCIPNPCEHGDCYLTSSHYRCECHKGYRGFRCRIGDVCVLENPCVNGVCVAEDSEPGYKCECIFTHTGEHCDQEVALNACDNDPCQNGGICSDGGLDYTCQCPDGFTGINCEEVVEVNPCGQFPPPCGDGICREDGLGFACECPPGRTGLFCAEGKILVVDPCSGKPCKNGGVCKDNGLGGYTCSCSTQYTGKNCEKAIDPCSLNPCENEGVCKNDGLGDYTCSCSSQYTGKNCENVISFCKANPCVNGECVLIDDGFTCICYAGFQGERCNEEIDFCNPDPCKNGGTCTSTTKGASCACVEGYTGERCERVIDYCDPNPCVDGTCIKEIGGFTCNCGIGVSGVLCEQVDFCVPSPCVHGQCTRLAAGYECKCDAGYTGKNCDAVSSDPCSSSPCQNGGTCVTVGSNYWCYCAFGSKGKNCDIPDEWDVYTKCTKTCDGGSRYKIPKCDENDITKCPRVYEGCNYNPCPANPGCRFGGRSYKYKSTSQCCNATFNRRCGVPGGGLFERIIGGYLASHGAWPWAALLHIATPRGTNATCGSTLIHKDWVLTAGHCVEKVTKERVTVIFGTTNPALRHTSMRVREVEQIILHEEFSFPTNDIALLKLKTSVEFTNHIRPICLPNGERVGTDTMCFAVGWGIARVQDIIHRIPSDNLMEVGIRNLDFGVCRAGYYKTDAFKLLNQKMLCAGSVDGGVDTCMGDSGGPLMCQRCDSCAWFLAGVTSFGSSNCGVPGRPGIYSSVLAYESWIRKHIDDLVDDGQHTCAK